MSNNPQELLTTAIQHHQAGKLTEAEQLYQKVLQSQPDNADALHMLGVLAYQLENYKVAIDLIRKALAINPTSAEMYTNLGSAIKASGNLNEAMSAFQRAIELNPNFALAHFNLGNTLHATDRIDEAIVSFKNAIAIYPEYADAYVHLGNMYKIKGNNDEAISSFQKALEIDPDNNSARHLIASLSGKRPKTAPAEYVADLFDGYADNFDQHLVSKLEYKTPTVLNTTVRRLLDDNATSLKILDLGCGTGLCGPLFRDIAGELVGVDLSPKMIEKAQARNIYDDLQVGDISTALKARTGYYDLVIAADVFVYVGDLDEVFKASYAALKPGGLFAFSVESADENDSYVLRPSGRYAHSVRYIRELAEKHNLHEHVTENTVLRKEKNTSMNGQIIVLGRVASVQ